MHAGPVEQCLEEYWRGKRSMSDPHSFLKPAQTYLSDERKQELKDLAKHLSSTYPNLGRGVRYLQQLAGEVAVTRQELPQLQFILNGASPNIYRGAPVLQDPEPHAMHRLRVQFHRSF